MRVKHISVKNLFGVFNHDIPMKLVDRITIIHGPNGFGKTAILRLVDGLFNARYSELRTTPFHEFTVTFEDETALRVTKSKEQLPLDAEITQSKVRTTVAYCKDGTELESFSLSRTVKSSEAHIPLNIIEEFVPNLYRQASRTWMYGPTRELLSLEDVFERFGDLLPNEVVRTKNEPKWFKEIVNAVDVRFIQTQRLLSFSTAGSRRYANEPSVPLTEVVAQYSTELASAIKQKVGEYAALSQSLDRTFPVRLVNEEVPEELTVEVLREQLSALEEKRNRLTAAGLLEKEKDVDIQVPPVLDERTRGVLSVYIKDVQEKLSIFDEMAAKIDLFKQIINDRFKYKEMSISKEKGITFTTSDNSPLSPTILSSGEQHELVLLYEFLFKVKPNALILIDEPEISLHIAWQEQFLRDLQRITDLAFFDVLIATHSPQIIYDRWDLTVKLEGPDENGSKAKDAEGTALATSLSTK